VSQQIHKLISEQRFYEKLQTNIRRKEAVNKFETLKTLASG
jgi:hypothetical protein